MPYVLKTDAFSNLEAGDEVELTERCYYGGGAISAGDEVFIWYSGSLQHLAWSGRVLNVEPSTHPRATVTVRLIAKAVAGAPTVADLAPLRNSTDVSAMSRLSRKLYKHAHNKISALSGDEASFLRSHFPSPTT